MSGLPILDLVVGMLFIYFLLSVINNSLFELGASALRLRSKYLEKWLTTTFTNQITDPNTGIKATLAHVLMDHPLLNGLSEQNKSTSYMAANDFATALIDLVTSEQGKLPALVQDIEDSLQNTKVLPESLRRTFLMYLSQAKLAAANTGNTQTVLDLFHKQIEDWFDNTMNRVAGLYKRKTLLFSAIFATIITVGFNIDSVALMNYLYSNPQVREKLAVAAYNAAEDTTFQKTANDISKRNRILYDSATTPAMSKALDTLTLTVDSFRTEVMAKKQATDTIVAALSSYFPIGWNSQDIKAFSKAHANQSQTVQYLWFFATKLPGFLITILALCLGAPFWFDVLSKVANIRNSVKPLASA